MVAAEGSNEEDQDGDGGQLVDPHAAVEELTSDPDTGWLTELMEHLESPASERVRLPSRDKEPDGSLYHKDLVILIVEVAHAHETKKEPAQAGREWQHELPDAVHDSLHLEGWAKEDHGNTMRVP
ncbi:hypothetical protein WJX72_003604 [[Myrmecia] bisecta]|uniref:Uncharacterized protein n=1 Tax=[Myrmecia] bisecta TaxID=41462 RepID=A0AAW1PXL1_9CHLO